MTRFNIVLLLCISFSLAACDSFGDLQHDPNRATEVNPSLLLTSIEANAFAQVSLSSALASRHLIYIQSIATEQYYSWQRGGFGAYDNLRQVDKMMEEAERTGAESYIALGKFFRAYYFHQLTQTFGDIPYSEALKGDEGSFTPVYDRQEEVYVGILNELEEANAMLHPDNGAVLGDIIYNGDFMKWRKFINSFRLRVLMSLSAKEGNSQLNVVEQFRVIVNNPGQYPIFTSNEDNAQLVYVDRDDNRYPLFNHTAVRSHDYVLEEVFVNRLKEREDPRLFVFADPENKAVQQGIPGYETDFSSYSGLPAGALIGENVQRAGEGLGSPLNTRYHTDPVAEPSVLLSYAEVEFILAEAAQRGWIAGSPEEHYENAIEASMKFYAIPEEEIAGYLQHPLVRYDPGRGIEMISTQKHIAFFLNSGWQPFYNQRRTGFPEFPVGPATQNGGRIPKRWMYPQSELDYNPDNVTQAIQRQYGSDDVNGVMWSLILE